MKKCLVVLMLFSCSLSSWAGKGYLSYEAFQRLNDPIQQQKDSDWLGFNFTTSPTRFNLDGYAELDFRYYYGNNDYMYSAPEAYIKYDRPGLEVIFGRQIVDWNPADARWGLADLNGLQGFSLLGDKQEGIVGLKLDMRLSRRVNLEVFASYFHIPSFNPGYQFDNGKVSSRSEWVRLPPTHTTILEEDVPITYDYDKVKIKDIVFQESFGTRLSFHPNKKNRISTYALYKPENKVRMNAEGCLDASMEHVAVTAKPYVNHHLLAGINFQSQMGRKFFLSGGYEYIDPNAGLKADLLVVDPVTFFENDTDDFDADYFKIQPKQEKNHYLHLSASWMGTLREFSVQLINSFNELKSGGDDFFGGTVKWQRAVGIKFKRHFSDRLKVLLNLKYDFLMKDSILKNEVSYRFFNNIIVATGVELIRSPNKASYWGAYRSNDTFFTNLRYLF